MKKRVYSVLLTVEKGFSARFGDYGQCLKTSSSTHRLEDFRSFDLFRLPVSREDGCTYTSFSAPGVSHVRGR